MHDVQGTLNLHGSKMFGQFVADMALLFSISGNLASDQDGILGATERILPNLEKGKAAVALNHGLHKTKSNAMLTYIWTRSVCIGVQFVNIGVRIELFRHAKGCVLIEVRTEMKATEHTGLISFRWIKYSLKLSMIAIDKVISKYSQHTCADKAASLDHVM